MDGSRFMIPLAYLNCPIFQELLSMTEEEFRFMRCGPLQVPCEASLMEYIVSLLSKNTCRHWVPLNHAESLCLPFACIEASLPTTFFVAFKLIMELIFFVFFGVQNCLILLECK
ncbi:hypothetical protein AMTRI_Chr05g72090 [Amborella trichopoda]